MANTYNYTLHPNGFTAADDKPQKRSMRSKIKREYQYRIEGDVKKFRQALIAAESPISPDRRMLYAIYREIEMDDHVAAQCRQAVAAVLQEAWELEGASPEILATPWFVQYLRHAIETEFWGHTLLEFNPEMKEGEFSDLVLIPREHVRPEFGDVRLTTSDSGGVPYRSKDFKYLVEIGEAWDLGLFKVVALPAIRKKYADTDWSLFSEKFGMPFTVVKTSSRLDAEINEKVDMLTGLGANGWAILDDKDSLDFIDAKNSANPHLVFQDRIALAESQISKVINGQTGTSDEKSFVGAAQVHERTMDKFTWMRLTAIQYHINTVLLPFLASHGYPCGKAKFKFRGLQHPDPTEMQPTDPNETPAPPEKKSLSLDTSEVDALYLAWKSDCCGVEQSQTLAYKHPTQAHKDLKAGVWSGEIVENHPSTFSAYFRTIAQGITDATGQDWAKLDKNSPDYEMLVNMRANAAEFAAAKMRRVIVALADARKAANGSKAAFNSAAQSVLDKHADWLRVEYDQAIAAAQMGVKWRELTAETSQGDMLRYVTAGDGRVRPLHKVLDGATFAPTSDFWDTHCPPLGYRCRCTLVKVANAAEKSPLREPTEKESPSVFRFNPAKTGRLFGVKHPYFQGIAAAAIAAAMLATEQIIFEDAN